jgi:hypothetical protein
MIGIRRLAAAAAVSSIAIAFTAASPAGAASAPGTPEVFQGAASASALDLSLLGQAISIGHGQVTLNSSPLVSVKGIANLTPLGSTTSAVSLSKVGAAADGPKCDPSISVAGLSIANACTTASSTIGAAGDMVGQSHATVDGIDLSLPTTLGTLQLGQIGNQVQTVLQNTLTQVDQLLGQPVQQLTSSLPINQVVSDLLHTKTLTISVGDSNSQVVKNGASVTSTAAANGLTLKVLPAPTALNGALAPLATVTVGKASATATYDRATGKAVSSFDPALVTVDVGPIPGLLTAQHISIPVGTTQTITLPGLGSITLQVADGSTFTNPDGTVGAVANAVKVSVELLNQPLLNLAIAGAEATVAGARAVPAALTPSPAKITPQVLPHTGGYPWMPLAGGFVLVGFLVTRRMMAAGAR